MMIMEIKGIPMHDMDKPNDEGGMTKRGSECPETCAMHICPEPNSPSIQMEDPINGVDPKSIEIGIFGPRWE